MAKKNYDELATKVVDLVGGKENISYFTHCITRLRFNVKDKGLVKIDSIKKLKDVIGTQWLGEQLQVIIGTDVPIVYKMICAKHGLKPEAAIDENLDINNNSNKGNIITRIIDPLSKSIIPVCDVIIPASFVMLIVNVLGPTQLNVISAESDLYKLFTFVGNAGFYFLPIYMGFSSAKTFKASPYLGALIGGVMIHPTLIEMVTNGTAFTVYGIPMTLVNYSSTIIPIFMVVWIMSYIERFFKRYMPKIISPIFKFERLIIFLFS